MAVVEVRLPTVLHNVLNCPNCVQSEGSTVGEVIEEMDKKYPGLKGRITDLKGKLNTLITIFVNDQDIRFKQEFETPLQDGDVLFILPAIAGGIFCN